MSKSNRSVSHVDTKNTNQFKSLGVVDHQQHDKSIDSSYDNIKYTIADKLFVGAIFALAIGIAIVALIIKLK